MKFKLMMWADEIGHRIHLPPWVICNRFERHINPPSQEDTPDV